MLMFFQNMCDIINIGDNMNVLLMISSKFLSFILKKMGRGSTYPGDFVLKSNPKFLEFFKPAKYVVYVTGTNGKSTVTHMLVSTFKNAGYKVGHNTAGSNLIEGITTCFIENSTIFGKSKVDIMVLEIDERYVKKVLPTIKATHFVITNISRDQPQRQGNFEFVYDEITRGLNTDAHLFLNSDDPICSRFGFNYPSNVTYFSLESTNNHHKAMITDNLDAVYCPICSTKLVYNYVHYGSIGSFYCKNGHFENSNKKYTATLLDDESIKIDGQIVKVKYPFFYNLYNAAICYSVARAFDIDKQVIAESIENMGFKRNEEIAFGDKVFSFLLSKNENAISYNQSINYVANKGEDCVVVIGFENVSRRYPYRDLSWIYDIEFENLKNESIKNVVCTGKFCYDLAARLKLAGIDAIICEDTNHLIDTLTEFKETTIFGIFCFEIEKSIKKILKERL